MTKKSVLNIRIFLSVQNKIKLDTAALCVFKYIPRNHEPPKERFKNPFELCLSCRNESRLIKSPVFFFFLQCELKPDTRVPKSDLSLETGASLAIYLCGHEKKHKVALSLGSVWYAAAGAPELRDTARTESRDFKSNQCPPPPASEAAEETDDALFSTRSNRYISVAPPNHHACYPEHRKPGNALFWWADIYVKTGMSPDSESFFICLSNMHQETQSGDFRGSFSFFQLRLQRMSCILTSEKTWMEGKVNDRETGSGREKKGRMLSDKDRLQMMFCSAIANPQHCYFSIKFCGRFKHQYVVWWLLPYSRDAVTAGVSQNIKENLLCSHSEIAGVVVSTRWRSNQPIRDQEWGSHLKLQQKNSNQIRWNRCSWCKM